MKRDVQNGIIWLTLWPGFVFLGLFEGIGRLLGWDGMGAMVILTSLAFWICAFYFMFA